MKNFNYVFATIIFILLISSSIGIFFVAGDMHKIISTIFISLSVFLVTNGVYSKISGKKLDKDERNVSIEEKSKAMAFDIMGIVFGILIIIYSFLIQNLFIILLAIFAYLIIFAVYMIYFSKYHKEM